jgi:hypothetical protein
MADVQANIGINIDATAALAQLKNLQRQISVFNAEIARGGGKAAAAAASMQQELVSSINATGQFSASMTSIRSTTESFTNALEKNKLTMGQTFRYAGGASKKFGKLFTNEFNTIEKVARERVKTIQTQYIKMGRDANGAIKAIAVRPLALDMDNLATRTAMAAQKQQILNQLLRQGSTNLLNWGKNTQWAGRQLMVGFTIPLSIFGGLAAKTFMDLEEQAIRFKRVYGDLFTTPEATNQAFEDMKALGLEFTRFGVSVEKTIGLAASVAQMGMTGAALTAQVTEATRLAVLGGMEQEEALNTTISLTNAFGVSAEDLTGKINFLNAAENQTILSIQDFNEAVPRAGSVVAQLGGDVEDLAFFLTAMREGGIEASQGANALKTSLGRLVNPTARAREELMGYGIDVVNIVESNAGNLRQTVLDLGTALDQLDPLSRARAIERLFGKFQFARMSALFSNIMDEGSQAATVLDLINTNASELGDLASKELGRVEESAATKFRSAIEQFQAALAPVGESFLKLVTPIIEFGTKVVNAFNGLSDGTKAFVVGLLGIVGAVGPVLLMTVGLLANGIANIMKMFLGLQTVFQRMRGQTTELGAQTQYMSQEQLEAAAVASSLNQSHATLSQTFTSEASAVQRLTTEYQKLVAAQRSSLGIPMRAASVSAPGFAKGKKVPGYRDGVVTVPGPKGAGDIQPAMLAPGEAVIPAAMAEKYGPLINAMIDGSIPGYVKGLATSTKTAVASHVSGADPRQLAETIRRLSEAGYEFTAVVDRMTANADGLGYTLERTEGSLADLVNTTDILVAGGSTFAGTTVPESADRNAMYNAVGISGSALTMDELFQQEQQLIAVKQENGDLYKKHSVEIERLIAESREQQAVLASSTDQAQTKLAYDKERARQAIAFAKVTQDGMSQELAEQQAGELVEQADIVYANAIKQGYSKEEALNQARDRLLASMIQSGSGQYVAGDSSIGTDPIRARAAGKSFATKDPIRKAFNQAKSGGRQGDFFTYGEGFGEGERLSPSSGKLSARGAQDAGLVNLEAEGQRLIVAARESVSSLAKETVVAMENQLKNDLQSASPSKVMRDEMGNAVDGAVLALKEGKDDMQQGGQELAQAAEQGFNNFPAEGATPGTRGGKGRVQTAGPTTPGQPIKYSIVNSEMQETAEKTASFGTKVSNAASSVAGMSTKLGTVGIGLSSLVGGLSMVEGPLGELASKLFPLMSVVTGLTFAMQMLSAETIKSIGDKLDDAIADGMSAKSARSKAVADAYAAKMSQINATAKQREAVASNLAARADTAEAAASTAATRGLAAMTATSMFAGGGAVGRTAGNMVGDVVAGANMAKSGIGSSLLGAQAALTRVMSKFGTMFAKLGAGLSKAFGMLGSAVSGLFKGLLSLLGPVGLIIAGLALLAGGIALLVKVMNDQKAKVEGLGDAAKLSGDKLNTLNEILGADLKARDLSGVGGTGAEGTGARTGDTETQKTAQDIQAQLLENEDFQKEFRGTINALEDASVAGAEQALTSMAASLQTAGASEEMIAGIVNALLEEANRTDVVLDFSSISIKTAEESAAEAARAYAESFANSTKNISDEEIVARASTTAGSGVSTYIGNIGGAETEADRALAAGALSSLILDANQQMQDGLITIDEYNAAIAGVGETINSIASTDASGLASASLLVAQMAKDMDEAGFEGVAADVQSFLDLNTAGGLDAATTVMSARAAGVDISETEMQTLQAGATEGADERVVRAKEAATRAIEKRTTAALAQAEADQKVADAREDVVAFESAAEDQNAQLQEQLDVYDDVSDAIANNSEILDKNAFAQKIAADETLRQQWASAQLVDAEEGNTEATQAFIRALQERTALEAQIDAQANLANIENAITQKQRETNATEALGIALGDSAEAQGIMNNAQASAFVLSQLAAQGFDTAAMSATELAAAIEGSGILQILASMKESGAFDFTVPKAGGGGGTPTSFLDDITKGLRDVASSSVKATKGFAASLRAITSFGRNGARSIRGLSSQLRGAGASEPFIEKILGMDPAEWEKKKRQLFNFDAAGNITGLTAAGEAIQDALNVIEIGKFIDEQESITVSVGNQISALNKLTAAGASYEAAYKAVQNTAFAAAIATAKSSAEIQAAAQAAMQAQEMMAKFEKINEEEERKKRISEAVREMNKEFSNQAKILDYINNNRSKLSEAQIGAILNNKDLQSLVLEPSIDPGALSTALANAERQADLELRIKKLTVEGQGDIFQEGISNAMAAFDAQEQEIELEFQATVKDDSSLVKAAEDQIALISYELDDYQAGLDEIDRAEERINEAYDQRADALDKIAEINNEITASQQAQLDLADALSQGDIAAAARAAQEMRSAQAETAQAASRRMLEEQRAAEVSALRSSSGMAREDLQAKVRELEEEIFNIEEKTLEPASERIRLAELRRDAQIEDLKVLEKTREEWDRIANNVDVAQAKGWRFAESMQEALDIVEKLIDNLTTKPAPPPPPPPPAPVRSSGGGGGGPELERKSEWTFAAGPNAGKRVADVAKDLGYAQWQDFYNSNPGGIDQAIIPKIKGMNMGGIVKKYAGGMIIPKRMASGGYSMGTDTVPAMLTPGEFVIRRPAVSSFGAEKLEKINSGTYNDGSVYNYNLAVNVKSDSDPNRIARAVITNIKSIENQRIRGNKL